MQLELNRKAPKSSPSPPGKGGEEGHSACGWPARQQLNLGNAASESAGKPDALQTLRDFLCLGVICREAFGVRPACRRFRSSIALPPLHFALFRAFPTPLAQ